MRGMLEDARMQHLDQVLRDRADAADTQVCPRYHDVINVISFPIMMLARDARKERRYSINSVLFRCSFERVNE